MQVNPVKSLARIALLLSEDQYLVYDDKFIATSGGVGALLAFPLSKMTYFAMTDMARKLGLTGKDPFCFTTTRTFMGDGKLTIKLTKRDYRAKLEIMNGVYQLNGTRITPAGSIIETLICEP